MKESPQNITPENLQPPAESVDQLETSRETKDLLEEQFDAAERFAREGKREFAKTLLPNIYQAMIKLNNLNPEFVINPLQEWNPRGKFTEDEFEKSNRRRKILSNVIGIMTASGKLRHNLNPDVPESFE